MRRTKVTQIYKKTGNLRAVFMDGPEPTLAMVSVAAPRLNQTCHSCIAQHFQGVSDLYADFAAVCVTNLIVRFDNDNEPTTA